MRWNFAKFIGFLFSLIFWILLALLIVSCANLDKVQKKEGWFPVGMEEDAQSFYNSKYNTLDNGYNDPNMNIKVFNTKY